MAQDITWSIAGIGANSMLGREHPTFIRGESETHEFLFDESAILDGGSTAMVLGRADGGTLGGTAGGTLGEVDTTTSARDRYLRLRDYIETSGTNAVGTTLGGEVYVREYLTDEADVDTRLVRLEPNDDIRLQGGYWVAIDGGEVLTESPGAVELALDVTYLAHTVEYSSRSDLLDDLSSPVTQI